jgi:aminodeoxyfutalosine synthase
MDNFKNIKAYWPMLGRQSAQMSLSFGVNDLDGTIDDTTKIYSMAGAEEQNPSMSTEDLCQLIRMSHKIPVERDTEYNELKVYNLSEVN